MPEPQPEIDQILLELFTTHKEAWQEIRRRMPSVRDENHAALAAALCERLSVTHGPSWRFTVRRERYVRVFRPEWSAFGFRQAEAVIGLADSEYGATEHSRVHFRLTAAPAVSGIERWKYDARIRVDSSELPDLGAALRSDIRAIGYRERRDPSGPESMIPLKTSTKLPPLNAPSCPDAVLEWFMKYLGRVIPVLDRHLGKGESRI